MIASVIVFAFVAFSGPSNTARKDRVSAQVYGDFQCTVALMRGDLGFDGEIHEYRSIGARLFSWSLDKEKDSLSLVGRCGFGSACRRLIEKLSDSYVIEVDSNSACKIRRTNGGDVFD